MTVSLTAKHFQRPLLGVMAKLTRGQANVFIRADDTYAPVMSAMGIADINELGPDESSGLPLVQRQIQWACKNLRKQGWMEVQGRGRWSLTAEGVLETMRAPTDVEGDDQDDVQEEEDEAPMSAEVVTLDPYFAELLLSQTACAGFYTPHKGAECVTCPVQSACREKQFHAYALAAASFVQAEPTPTKPPEKKKKRMTRTQKAASLRIRASQEMLCACCRESIPKDSYCFWYEDVNTGTSLMYHEACAETTSD